jgi:hypothetical protein
VTTAALIAAIVISAVEICRRLGRLEATIAVHSTLVTDQLNQLRAVQAHAVENQLKRLGSVEESIAGASTELRIAAAQITEPAGE